MVTLSEVTGYKNRKRTPWVRLMVLTFILLYITLMITYIPINNWINSQNYASEERIILEEIDSVYVFILQDLERAGVIYYDPPGDHLPGLANIKPPFADGGITRWGLLQLSRQEIIRQQKSGEWEDKMDKLKVIEDLGKLAAEVSRMRDLESSSTYYQRRASDIWDSIPSGAVIGVKGRSSCGPAYRNAEAIESLSKSYSDITEAMKIRAAIVPILMNRLDDVVRKNNEQKLFDLQRKLSLLHNAHPIYFKFSWMYEHKPAGFQDIHC